MMKSCSILRYDLFFSMSSFSSFDEWRMVKRALYHIGGLQEAADFIRGFSPCKQAL